MHRQDVLRMTWQRFKAASLASSGFGCYTFRATGVTVYLTGVDHVETAQKMAGHANAKPTSLCDLRNAHLPPDKWERIAL